MPAAPLRDRRVKARPRASGPGDRSRPRASRPSGPPTSKLRAARSVGLTAPMAGAAAALLAVLILAAALATGGRARDVERAAEQTAAGASRLWGQAQGLIQGRFADMGFRVAAVHLQGASPASRNEILRAVAVSPGEPILGLDLRAVRARVERVAWVQSARVIRLLPDTLVVAVTERSLMAVWQHHGRRDLIAANGAAVTGVDPGHFTALPLVVGDGANTDAARFLAILAGRPGLVARLAAIRRVDQRRWDLILKDGGVILLPAADEAGALARLDQLDRSARVLALGLARLDLRDANFTVARPRGAPPPTVSHGV
jgi:cell division protein FtsQ